MKTISDTALVGRRYELQDLLGSGGMGVVHRAKDRLTGQLVALKQVKMVPDHLDFASRASGGDLRLSLANEFRTLASLRHPNIISVLDYGFDEHHLPFYTMDLLDSPQTIVQAGCDKPLPVQIGLLVGMLQALVYLHRRGIIHRDLKPSNVLVANEQARVLDFGVSVLHAQSTQEILGRVTGTLAYLSPEQLQGHSATAGSDLYAVGVIAYQLFAGHHPFDTSNAALLLESILHVTPDVQSLKVNTQLQEVLAKLLAKTREDRYGDSAEVIADLCNATNQPIPAETQDIRESFLQAATFVGRETELSQFVKVLGDAIAGQGGAWLIGGESGVGKSRLLEEMRIRALVQGALVLRGQAVSEGRRPYQMWIDALRWLCLLTGLGADQAGVLKEIIPDIGSLVGQEVPDAPPLDPQAAQARLFGVITETFRQQNQPIVLILEDMQWAGSESLALLARVASLVSERPLLVLASYRDDERPTLPDELPTMQSMKLPRLAEADIAALSEAMLGVAGKRADIVRRLQNESEGNAFFLVEVVRALAEAAGQLSQISAMAWPEKIFAGGVERLIHRRLARIPEHARPLLQLAAVAGRELDLALIKALEPELEIERWLAACANAAVLDVYDNRWLFAHDKLREGLVAEIPADVRPVLHRRVAGAMEAVSPGSSAHAAALAFHWGLAGDAEKERQYSGIAGQQAVRHNANAEAMAFFRRALELLERVPMSPPRIQEELSLLIGFGASLTAIKGYTDSELGTVLARARAICNQMGDIPETAPVLYLLLNFYGIRAEYHAALELGEQLLTLGERLNDHALRMMAHHELGWILVTTGKLTQALIHLDQAISMYDVQQHGHLAFLYGGDSGAGSLAMASWALWLLGFPDRALMRSREAIALAQKVNHLFTLASAQVTAGIYVHYFRRELAKAAEWTETALAFSAEHQFSFYLAVATHCSGWVMAERGQMETGIRQMRLGIAQQAAGTEQGVPIMLTCLAEECLKAGRVDDGMASVDEALALVGKTGERYYEAEMHRVKGDLNLLRQDETEAEQEYLEAIEVARGQSGRSLELRATTSLCQLWQKQGKIAQAAGKLAAICDWFTEGFGTLDYRSAKILLKQLTIGPALDPDIDEL